MTATMKGLLKGLRYISQIFDADTEEHEMQIGHPTDVKHVAHIGWDGPSVGAPSWTNECQPSSAPLSAPVARDGNEAGAQDTQAGDLLELPARRPARRNASSAGPNVDSSNRGARQARRYQSSGTANPPVREHSEGLRHSRGHRSNAGLRQESTVGSGSGGGSESQEGRVAVPKRDRPRRKTKGSSSGGSSVRSKAAASESEGVVESQSSYSFPSLKTMREEEGF